MIALAALLLTLSKTTNARRGVWTLHTIPPYPPTNPNGRDLSVDLSFLPSEQRTTDALKAEISRVIRAPWDCLLILNVNPDGVNDLVDDDELMQQTTLRVSVLADAESAEKWRTHIRHVLEKRREDAERTRQASQDAEKKGLPTIFEHEEDVWSVSTDVPSDDDVETNDETEELSPRATTKRLLGDIYRKASAADRRERRRAANPHVQFMDGPAETIKLFPTYENRIVIGRDTEGRPRVNGRLCPKLDPSFWCDSRCFWQTAEESDAANERADQIRGSMSTPASEWVARDQRARPLLRQSSIQWSL